ncbi:response regulator transcription factor [Actinosynnema sp. NPDC047251]|uniref:Uncharacterized protein n=1 Tax=Saccharothrix espanaensis (strain ATCC 51144 / DSM 44229 / JCM 9112 / NBRC 15066 / NRRL 15764) TaxID=1179773 RepID=K0K9B0_SACES|nr:response regulator transcription factor [Saccharothrix espanaensis]CCH33424.1 hypothetical protein BN6_61730 [Saccharothrix espanaensis DSM 44229]
MTTPTGDTCQVCGGPLPDSTETGRPRKFCSDRCRSRAHRVRKHETGRAAARQARQCDVEVAGHRCERAAAFVLTVDGRELKVCPACRELALAFLVGQGASATAVEARPVAGAATGPARAAPGQQGQGRVLVIEDDARVIDALSTILRQRGYEVVAARDGRTGLREALTRRPDLVLLDLGLPDIDGITLLRTLRAASDVPVVVVTARGEIDDIALGLDIGADDYIVKPCDVGELLARIRRAMRAATAPTGQVYDDGVLRVDLRLSEVSVGGTAITLSRREFRLVEFLVRSAGTVQSLDAIIAHVWADAGVVASHKRHLTVLVSVLRSKLAGAGLSVATIVTAHGLGYYYQPPNRPAPSPRIGFGHAERLLALSDERAPAARPDDDPSPAPAGSAE